MMSWIDGFELCAKAIKRTPSSVTSRSLHLRADRARGRRARVRGPAATTTPKPIDGERLVHRIRGCDRRVAPRPGEGGVGSPSRPLPREVCRQSSRARPPPCRSRPTIRCAWWRRAATPCSRRKRLRPRCSGRVRGGGGARDATASPGLRHRSCPRLLAGARRLAVHGQRRRARASPVHCAFGEACALLCGDACSRSVRVAGREGARERAAGGVRARCTSSPSARGARHGRRQALDSPSGRARHVPETESLAHRRRALSRRGLSAGCSRAATRPTSTPSALRRGLGRRLPAPRRPRRPEPPEVELGPARRLAELCARPQQGRALGLRAATLRALGEAIGRRSSSPRPAFDRRAGPWYARQPAAGDR